VWSPSGEWIACETAAGSTLVSPDGKLKRTLTRMDAFVMAWSKDSKTLYGLHRDGAHWSLLAEDIRSGAVRKVASYGVTLNPFTPLPYFGMTLSLSPDGKSFAVATEKRQTDLWVLEGFPK
jgi:hypothetical protein